MTRSGPRSLAKYHNRLREILPSVEGEVLRKDSDRFPEEAIWLLDGGKSRRKQGKTDLFEFEKLVKNEQFDGLLIILLSDEYESRLVELLSDRSFAAWSSIVDLSRAKSSLSSEGSLEQALAVAELVCLSGGASVVVCTRSRHKGPPLRLDKRLSPFLFKVATIDEVTEAYLAALTLRRKAGFHHTFRSHVNEAYAFGEWGPWSFDPTAECQLWIESEFSDPLARERFCSACSEALSESTKNREGIELKRYSKAHRIVLAAVRLCRRLATHTLEGTPFEFTVLIPKDTRDVVRFGLEPVLQLLSVDSSDESILLKGSDVRFNFDYMEAISNHAELAQSEALWMTVDPSDGRLLRICCWVPKDSDGARHLLFGKMTSEGGIIIHVRRGKVEVYGGSLAHHDDVEVDRFALGFDGFRWNVTPFKCLRNHLRRHFRSQRNTEALEAAIAGMLDHNESSLVVLVHADDEKLVGEGAHSLQVKGVLEPLRQEVLPFPDANLGRLQVEALRALLHVDGAHFIDNQGNLLLYAQRVKGPGERNDRRGNGPPRSTSPPKLQVPGVVRRRPPGSGRNAAMDLVRYLKRSTAIKVSASGNVNFFSYSDEPFTE